MPPPSFAATSNSLLNQQSPGSASSSYSPAGRSDSTGIPSLQQQAPSQIAAQMKQLAAKTLQQRQMTQRQQQSGHCSNTNAWQSRGFAPRNQAQSFSSGNSLVSNTSTQQQPQGQPAMNQHQLLALQQLVMQQQYAAMMASRFNNFQGQR